MELVGAKLKKIRLEKGLTLEEVHKSTKIQLKLLKAIEEGSTENMSPVYLKSFIKLYCNCLGVDYRDYLPEYRDPLGMLKRSQTQVPAAQPSRPDARPVSFIQSASVKMSHPASGTKMPIVIGIGLAVVFFIAVFLIGKLVTLRHARAGSGKTMSGQQKTRSTRRQETLIFRNQSTASPLPKPQIIIPTSGNTMHGVRLTIAAREDCWVKVKSDGKLLYYGILKKGRYDSWQAKDKIVLNLGNAGVVDINVNGQVISSIGRRGQVINDITITKDGLSIP